METEYLKIITTTRSFSEIAESSDIGAKLAEEKFQVVLQEGMEAPFSFSPDSVFAIVAGDRKLGPAEMDLFPDHKIIARFGTGVDNVNLDAARERGVVVTNVPALNALAVSEMTIAYIFALAKNLFGLKTLMAEGKWERPLGLDIRGARLGIVGLGNVGKEVAKLALGLGMEVGAADSVYDEEFLRLYTKIQKKELRELVSACDFLTLHIPLTPETRHLINAETLALMKPGSFLINTSRGEVVDESALLKAIEEGRIRGAALDVFPEEPPFQNEILQKLISHPRVIVSPHVASFTPNTRYAVGLRVLKNILAVRDGRLNETDRVA